jgi:mannose-6-phosphate isomerase-like protein (cupin superfamily)
MPARETSNQKKRLTIFRGSDAVDLSDTDFMSTSDRSADIPLDARERIGTAGGAGSEVKVLVRDAGGFSLVHAWFKANFPLPRHSHNVDCMYYVISGSAVMGSVILSPGDSFFVPADAPYQYSAGPDGVEVLEVRHGVETFDIRLAEVDPARWMSMADIFEATRGSWIEMRRSPTFAAAAGEGGDGGTPGLQRR